MSSNVLITIGKDVEKDIVLVAETVLHGLEKVQADIALSPKVLAAIGIVLAAAEKPIQDVVSAASNPIQVLNLSFDEQTLADLKAAWSTVKTEVAKIGIKLP